jgi:hypothetical protein
MKRNNLYNSINFLNFVVGLELRFERSVGFPAGLSIVSIPPGGTTSSVFRFEC